MAKISKNFVSIVAMGSLNPQILNVDFLKDNKIVPIDKPPFDILFQQDKPFTRFISTPVLSNLVLENIEFIIEQGRFQIRDVAVSEWAKTKVMDITKRYFNVLRYTPLKVIGINFNATISFSGLEEVVNFQKLFLSENAKVTSIISKDNITAGLVLCYPYSDNGGRITLILERLNKTKDKRVVSFNYEFDFVDWPKFKAELGRITEIADYFDSILSQILESI